MENFFTITTTYYAKTLPMDKSSQNKKNGDPIGVAIMKYSAEMF